MDYGSNAERITDTIRQYQQQQTSSIVDALEDTQQTATAKWQKMADEYTQKYQTLAEGGVGELAGAMGLKGIATGLGKIRTIYNKTKAQVEEAQKQKLVNNEEETDQSSTELKGFGEEDSKLPLNEEDDVVDSQPLTNLDTEPQTTQAQPVVEEDEPFSFQEFDTTPDKFEQLFPDRPKPQLEDPLEDVGEFEVRPEIEASGFLEGGAEPRTSLFNTEEGVARDLMPQGNEYRGFEDFKLPERNLGDSGLGESYVEPTQLTGGLARPSTTIQSQELLDKSQTPLTGEGELRPDAPEIVEYQPRAEPPMGTETPEIPTRNVPELSGDNTVGDIAENVGERIATRTAVSEGAELGIADTVMAGIPVVGEIGLALAGAISVGEGIYHLFHKKRKSAPVVATPATSTYNPTQELTQKYSLGVPSIDTAAEQAASLTSF